MPDISVWHNISGTAQEKKPPFTVEVREHLIEIYQEDIYKLQELIQRDQCG